VVTHTATVAAMGTQHLVVDRVRHSTDSSDTDSSNSSSYQADSDDNLSSSSDIVGESGIVTVRSVTGAEREAEVARMVSTLDTCCFDWYTCCCQRISRANVHVRSY
jgi:DNA repair ATPase RecN